MFANAFKFAQMVVATLYNRVDMRHELEIDLEVFGVGEMLLPNIYIGKEDVKSFR